MSNEIMRLNTVFSAVPQESEAASQLFRRGIAVQTSNPKFEGQLYTSTTQQILHGHFSWQYAAKHVQR